MISQRFLGNLDVHLNHHPQAMCRPSADLKRQRVRVRAAREQEARRGVLVLLLAELEAPHFFAVVPRKTRRAGMNIRFSSHFLKTQQSHRNPCFSLLTLYTMYNRAFDTLYT